MTISKLRTIDCLIFFALASIFDVVLGRFGLFGIRSYLAISSSILAMLYIRWGKAALIANLGIAVIHLFIFDVDWNIRIAHSLSLFVLGVMLVGMRLKPYQPTRIAFPYIILLFAFGYVAMFFAEWVLLMLFDNAIALGIHALNRLFDFLLGIGMLSLMAMQKELLIKMEPYLREKSEEKQIDG